MLTTRIAGIPCKVEVTHYLHQEAQGRWASNDADARGYTELEFVVCDQRGRPAPWLEAKVTAADRSRIAAEYRAELMEVH